MQRLPSSVPQLALEGLVVGDPVRHLDDPVLVLVVPDHHLVDACVDHHALAHGAADGVLHVLPGGDLFAHQVQGGADHVPAGGADDGVGLGVDGPAQLVPLPPGDAQLGAQAVAQVRAVLPAPGRPHIACGDHLVVFHDHRPVVLSQAGAALADGLRQIQVIVDFVPALQWFHLSFPREKSLSLHYTPFPRPWQSPVFV